MRIFERIIAFFLAIMLLVTILPNSVMAVANNSLTVITKQTVRTSGKNGNHTALIQYNYDTNGYLTKRTVTRNGKQEQSDEWIFSQTNRKWTHTTTVSGTGRNSVEVLASHQKGSEGNIIEDVQFTISVLTDPYRSDIGSQPKYDYNLAKTFRLSIQDNAMDGTTVSFVDSS